MELVPAGVPLAFEVTFDRDDLDVAMSVYDVTGVSPVLVQGPTAMQLVVGNTYKGVFTPEAGKNYLVLKAVYLSNTFAALDPDYSQGSETMRAEYVNLPTSACEITGFIESNNEIIGMLDTTPTLIGVVEC